MGVDELGVDELGVDEMGSRRTWNKPSCTCVVVQAGLYPVCRKP